MPAMIAVLRRRFIQDVESRFDHHLGVVVLRRRNVQITKLLGLERCVERGRTCLAVEAEYRFVICATRRCDLDRLCDFRSFRTRMRALLRAFASAVPRAAVIAATLCCRFRCALLGRKIGVTAACTLRGSVSCWFVCRARVLTVSRITMLQRR